MAVKNDDVAISRAMLAVALDVSVKCVSERLRDGRIPTPDLTLPTQKRDCKCWSIPLLRSYDPKLVKRCLAIAKSLKEAPPIAA